MFLVKKLAQCVNVIAAEYSESCFLVRVVGLNGRAKVSNTLQVIIKVRHTLGGGSEKRLMPFLLNDGTPVVVRC